MLLCVSESYAQFYFGKNKVQYTQFDWQMMTTEHFRIYFYEEETEVARTAARSAEDSYRILAAKFNHEVTRKIPLIMYSSPSYFSQTNVIPGLLPESVAGFTEFMKGRVVVPFNGSYAALEHVLRHELVHVFQLSKLEDHLTRRRRVRVSRPPLWFTEGLAEFLSKDWDVQSDMVVKDMVITNRLPSIPELWRIRGTYCMYKAGESICHFIDSTYGTDKLVQILENYHKGRTFDKVVKITLGDDLAELSRKWEYSLKRKYYPELIDLGLPRMESRRLSKDGYALNGVPFRWDDGKGVRDWLVYKANRRGYTGIYARPLQGKMEKTDLKTLLKGERSADFESLHLGRSGLDANDSGQVIFSSKSKENDVLYVYDLNSGHVTRRFNFDGLISITSPRFSPDGGRVVFSGVGRDGFSDLYLLNLDDGHYESLIDDIYYDISPCFSLDGKAVVFSSDRCPDGRQGATNLYSLDLASHNLRQLTYGPYRDASPEVTEHGIYFSSSREEGFNLFLLGNDGQLTRQSTYVTGAFDPRLSPDGCHLTYTGYEGMRYHIYEMELPVEPKAVALGMRPAMVPWRPDQIGGAARQTAMKYDTDYSFDIAQSSIGYDPVYGSIGGFQAAMTDVLGNRMFYLLVTNTSDTKDNLLESFNFGLTYINRERRMNWGVGAFHLYDEYFNDFDQFYFEREAGAITLLSYPVSKFSRFDFTTLARYSKRERLYGQSDREAFLVSNYLSWVYDNSLWEPTGPIEGRRYNLTIGLTNSVDRMRSFSRLAMVDIRHYFRLGQNSAFANRLFGYTSSGMEPNRIYFGGSWSFRGYDRRAFYTRNVLFASNELRFPLVDNLLLGFPFGDFGLRGIRGALFFDVGSAWEDEFDQFVGSFGGGFRVALGYIVTLRFDWTRTTNFRTISRDTDFDFFFGWNF